MVLSNPHFSGLLGLGSLPIQGLLASNHFSSGSDFPGAWGYGALFLYASFLFVFTQGIAARGWFRGDSFLTGSLGFISITVGLFTFLPVGIVLKEGFLDSSAHHSLAIFFERFSSESIWNLSCLIQDVSCGILWNTLLLGIISGFFTSFLGLAFALLITRSRWRRSFLMKLLSLLPVVTPPFAVGLAVILLFGRSGMVTLFLESHFGIPASRWVYGLPGILFSQILALTPIAFLVLKGVIEGVSPSLEEASQTLGASRWKTFITVSLPLMKPGIANVFLLGFIESLADFGNPLVLGEIMRSFPLKFIFLLWDPNQTVAWLQCFQSYYWLLP